MSFDRNQCPHPTGRCRVVFYLQELRREYTDLSHHHAADVEAREKQQQKRVTAIRSAPTAGSGLLRQQQIRTVPSVTNLSISLSGYHFSDGEFLGNAFHLWFAASRTINCSVRTFIVVGLWLKCFGGPETAVHWQRELRGINCYVYKRVNTADAASASCTQLRA